MRLMGIAEMCSAGGKEATYPCQELCFLIAVGRKRQAARGGNVRYRSIAISENPGDATTETPEMANVETGS